MSLPAFYGKKRKQKAGKAGFPEYTAVVGDFVLVMEDKADRANLCLKEADGTISMTVQATTDYAVNGALHYAQHILQKTTYKKVFAFGNAGDSKHHTLQPLFVDKNGYKWLPEVQTFENFSAAHEKILDSSTEYCICAEFCACDWNDWRVHFATTGVLHNHG